MDNTTIYKTISDVEYTLEKLKNDISTLENEKRKKIEQIDFEKRKHAAALKNANLMKKALIYFERGYSTFETAEKIAPDEWSIWDVYNFISSERAQNTARKRYARAYIVKALSDAGFSNVEISKIAGCTPQRCGQILKNKFV